MTVERIVTVPAPDAHAHQEVLVPEGRSWTRSWPKRFLLGLVTLSLTLSAIATTAASAEEDVDEYVTDSGARVQVTKIDDVRYYEASRSVTVQPDVVFYTPPDGITATGREYEVHFTNVISANDGRAKWVRYYYAHTKRLSGSGPYRAEAHATLIDGYAEHVISGALDWVWTAPSS